jgi:hypothetical protein
LVNGGRIVFTEEENSKISPARWLAAWGLICLAKLQHPAPDLQQSSPRRIPPAAAASKAVGGLRGGM